MDCHGLRPRSDGGRVIASEARQFMTSKLLRWLILVVMAGLTLQLFFIARIALMAVIDPQSTTFERSEAWRIATDKGTLRWRQQWVPYAQISDNLKRAVIASEDGSFVNHDGQVLATEVVDSSGNPVLDRRAELIARSAGPFGSFSDDMRRAFDQLVLVSRFKFTRDEQLEARVSGK